jgi:hypothetical protein
MGHPTGWNVVRWKGFEWQAHHMSLSYSIDMQATLDSPPHMLVARPAIRLVASSGQLPEIFKRLDLVAQLTSLSIRRNRLNLL